MPNTKAAQILQNELESTDRGDTYDALETAIALLNRVGEGFIITCVGRLDISAAIEQGDIENVNIEHITDTNMERIASKMADAYVEQVFHIDLPIIVESVMKN